MRTGKRCSSPSGRSTGLFFAAAGAAPGPPPGERVSPGALFAKLVGHGHDKERLPHYTRRQLELFYRYALRDEASARADRIDDIRLALAGKQLAGITGRLRSL